MNFHYFQLKFLPSFERNFHYFSSAFAISLSHTDTKRFNVPSFTHEIADKNRKTNREEPNRFYLFFHIFLSTFNFCLRGFFLLKHESRHDNTLISFALIFLGKKDFHLPQNLFQEFSCHSNY